LPASFGVVSDETLFIAQRSATVSKLEIQTIGCAIEGRVGMLFLDSNITARTAQQDLLVSAKQWMLDGGVELIRVMDYSGGVEADLLATGFRHATDVLFLAASPISTLVASHRESVQDLGPAPRHRRTIPRETPIYSDPVPFDHSLGETLLEPIPLAVTEELVNLVAETYVDSAEFVEHIKLSDPEKNLRDHLRHSGNDGHWWLLRSQARDVGVLLTGEANEGSVPLLYLGINKEHRSQGRGRQALKQAFEFFSTRKVNCISTQVDVHNDPAIRCYTAVGFHELSRSKLYVFQNR
jgi:ribosomal protein S18 acetylase RimI-like enzyme